MLSSPPCRPERQRFSLQLIRSALLPLVAAGDGGGDEDVDADLCLSSPETDHRLHQLQSDRFSEDRFDSRMCLQFLLEVSDGWSFRDIEKLVGNIRSSVLGSDR